MDSVTDVLENCIFVSSKKDIVHKHPNDQHLSSAHVLFVCSSSYLTTHQHLCVILWHLLEKGRKGEKL